MRYLHGAIDSFRMFSFAVSAEQVALFHILQAQGRVDPVLQINLHMQPNEYTEANWTHMGPNNRFQPTPSSFFPGWAAFNGQQSIDLLNPGSGMGVTWTTQLATADAFSVELWVRAAGGAQPSSFSILSADPLLSVYHDAASADGSLTVQREGSAGSVVTGVLTPFWTQLVIVCNSSMPMGGVFVNGSLTSTALQGGTTRGAPRRAMLGEGFKGELAIMRLFDRALQTEHVKALFNAQKAEEGRPDMMVGGEEVSSTEQEDKAALSLAGVIGLVMGLLAVLIATVIGLVLWRAYRSKGQTGQVRAEHGLSLLTQ